MFIQRSFALGRKRSLQCGKKFISGFRLAVFSLLAVATQEAGAATLTPSAINETVAVGSTVTVTRTVTVTSADVGGDTGSGGKVDVFFLADNTGSMGALISGIKSSAGDVLAALNGGDSRFSGLDAAFGVGSYFGDPGEFYFGTPESKGRKAYKLQQPIATDDSLARQSISDWVTVGGEDEPEANFFALHQVATEGGTTDGNGSTDQGYATGQVTGWRPGARRIVVWFGDAASHTSSVDQAEAIAALKNAGVTVIAINALIANFGIDRFQQATAVASATGGVVKNGVTSSDAVKQAILDALGSVTSGNTVDLSMSSSGLGGGLQVTYTCISPGGCNAVPAGESRTFAMAIKGLTAGTYSFQTIVGGVQGLSGNDFVEVTQTTPPPTGGSCNCPATPADCAIAARTTPGLVCGTDGDDFLGGRTDIRNTFCTYGGNDAMMGSSLGDCYDTGPGNDGILAGDGDDLIFTGPGDDRVESGAGDDVIDTGAGNDRVSSGPGDDTVTLGDGDDRASLGDGDDQVEAGPGSDRLDGGKGDDSLDPGVSQDDDRIDGGPGIDNCFGAIGKVQNCES